ncbi:MAG TPA: M20 family metallopeptidase [Candidatus Dormibacteraeota bacterium]
MAAGLELNELVERGRDAAIDLRRDLHAHPELSDAEHRTTAVLRERLGSLKLRDVAVPTPTGAVAVLEGGRPGLTVLLRADIDALPVEEAVDVPFRSRTHGVMHACGHDGHAAILMAVAAALTARAEALPGRYALVFQPAEETISGARRMIVGGLLEELRPDLALGLHLASLLPTGLVGHRAGIAMSAARTWRLILRGTGGHAAMSSDDGNVVAAAAALTSRLGAVAAGLEYREIGCVCAAGVLQAGTRYNVVPTRARVEGTLRTFTAEQDAETTSRLSALADTIAAEFGVSADLELIAHTPAVVNDERVTATAAAAAAQELGAEAVFEMPPMTPSDDMSEFLARVPGVYLTLGARPGEQRPPMHHAPDFAIDERSLQVGARVLAAAAVALARP